MTHITLRSLGLGFLATVSINAMVVVPPIVLAADAPTGRDMVYIPAGEFEMGTSQDEAHRLAEEYGVHPTLFLTETPRRTVHLEAFLLDRFPVTNAQYKEFVTATRGRQPANWIDGSFPEGTGDHPVTCVNWQAAKAYADWAGLRLSTEAEWEKAARGADGRRWPWGNEWNGNAVRTDDPAWPQTRSLTTPVGAFPLGAGPYGVMDLAGNVAEWTSTPSQPVDPKRGWAWYAVKGAGGAHSRPYNFRPAARNFSAHTSRWHFWLGFRCAKDAPAGPDVKSVVKQIVDPPAVPPVSSVAGPREEVFGSQAIGVASRSGHSAVIHVPYFPVGQFSLNLPEQVGAAGLPFGWSAENEGIHWTENQDGSCEYECVFTGKARMRVVLAPGSDYVDFTISLENLTGQAFGGVNSNTCLNVHASPYFEDPERVRSFVWTDDGPTCMLRMPIGGGGEPLHGGWSVAGKEQEAPAGGGLVRHPIVAIRSRDGRWMIAQAYAEGTSVASNAHYSCLHSRPLWPDIPAGEERSLTGKLYFIRGGPEELLSRWKSDFGK